MEMQIKTNLLDPVTDFPGSFRSSSAFSPPQETCFVIMDKKV